jgi:hypothetical protein
VGEVVNNLSPEEGALYKQPIGFVKAFVVGGTNFEARNPNDQNPLCCPPIRARELKGLFLSLENSRFEFVSNFDIRISDLSTRHSFPGYSHRNMTRPQGSYFLKEKLRDNLGWRVVL